MKNNLKCKTCKKQYDFYYHKCSYAFHEYYGCETCDNLCMRCDEDYANRIINRKNKV